MDRKTELILLALDFYAKVRGGAAAPETKQLAQEIRDKQLTDTKGVIQMKKKTYFMAWETVNRRGHAIYEFDRETTPRQALSKMLEFISSGESEKGETIQGSLNATQFNQVT